MTLPDPVPSLVIRHAFLWSHEVARGQREASKSRPCAIVIAAVQDDSGGIRVTVAPITHSPPDDDTACVKLPAKIARKLGLDDESQWLRFDELNYFDWPGFDLSPLPGTDARYDYGRLPRGFFERVRETILKRVRAGKRKVAFGRDQ